MNASYAQDEMLKEAMELNSGAAGATPRFYSPRLATIAEYSEDERYGDMALTCCKSLDIVTQGVNKLSEA